MDEPTVFKHVLTYLEANGFDSLVHFPPSFADKYRDIAERYPRHQITVGGRYPDIIGFTPRNQVFAVEVKGESDILKGIGQAVTYQQGSHITYLAATDTILDQKSSELTAQGIGIIGVDENGVCRQEDPRGATAANQVSEIEGKLTYRLQQNGRDGSVSAVSLTYPFNFFAPAVAVADADSINRDELLDRVTGSYGVRRGTARHAIDGAEVLGFIRSNGLYTIGKQGQLALATLQGCVDGDLTLTALHKYRDSIHGQPLVEAEPSLAILLQNAYRQHPDFRLFIEALQKFENKVEFPTLLEELVKHYPNVFLNLVCKQPERNTAREFLEAGNREQIYTDRDTWESLIRSNVISNFVNQLKHIGILHPDTAGHGGAKRDYDPQAKPWILRDTSLA